jgi:hypothetical protein
MFFVSVAGDRTILCKSDIDFHENENEHGYPLMYFMDSQNKFQSLTCEKDVVKLAKGCEGYRPGKEQQYFASALMQSKDASEAAHDIYKDRYIRSCRKENQFTDVNIHNGDGLFTAHRIMLAKYSTYFMELFCASESSYEWPCHLNFIGISGDATDVFLQFVYEGDRKITPALVKDLSKLAIKFDVELLRISI